MADPQCITYKQDMKRTYNVSFGHVQIFESQTFVRWPYYLL